MLSLSMVDWLSIGIFKYNGYIITPHWSIILTKSIIILEVIKCLNKLLKHNGLIQRFEFTYDLSYKTLKSYLESVSLKPEEYDSMPFADMIRTANEQGLLQGNWSKWGVYRDMYTKANHTYDEDIALEVVAGIPQFLAEACFLRDVLRERLA